MIVTAFNWICIGNNLLYLYLLYQRTTTFYLSIFFLRSTYLNVERRWKCLNRHICIWAGVTKKLIAGISMGTWSSWRTNEVRWPLTLSHTLSIPLTLTSAFWSLITNACESFRVTYPYFGFRFRYRYELMINFWKLWKNKNAILRILKYRSVHILYAFTTLSNKTSTERKEVKSKYWDREL